MNAFILKEIIAQIVNFYNNLFFVFFKARDAHQWSGGYQEMSYSGKQSTEVSEIFTFLFMLEKDMPFLIGGYFERFLKSITYRKVCINFKSISQSIFFFTNWVYPFNCTRAHYQHITGILEASQLGPVSHFLNCDNILFYHKGIISF